MPFVSEKVFLRQHAHAVRRCDCGGPESGTDHAPNCDQVHSLDELHQAYRDTKLEWERAGVVLEKSRATVPRTAAVQHIIACALTVRNGAPMSDAQIDDDESIQSIDASALWAWNASGESYQDALSVVDEAYWLGQEAAEDIYTDEPPA